MALAPKTSNAHYWENHFALKSFVYRWSRKFWDTLFLQLLDEEDVAALLGPKTGVTAWIAAVKRATGPHFDEVHKMVYRSISRTNPKRAIQNLDDSSVGNSKKPVTIVSKLWLNSFGYETSISITDVSPVECPCWPCSLMSVLFTFFINKNNFGSLEFVSGSTVVILNHCVLVHAFHENISIIIPTYICLFI